ncbi:MAG: restriction endonuclease PLD domain-containing protein, partial [Flavobacterium sp.]
MIIASPFLMTDFSSFLKDINPIQLNSLVLITTLTPKSVDQIKKINSLISLIEFPSIKDKTIDCKVCLNNKLHGKVYIFKKNGDYLSAIISSANFTDSGLSFNHEWGVEIFEKETIISLEESILGSIEHYNVPFEEMHEMYKAALEFKSNSAREFSSDIELNLTSYLSTPKQALDYGVNVEFWLKPIGVTGQPVPEDRLFNNANDTLHFSKQRPNAIKRNDILIAYGVGSTKILSIYRVTSSPLHVSQEEIEEDDWLERWPWYVEAQNLTPNFGATWPKHNLYKNSLVDDYLMANPQKPLTAVGGQTLGALNFGKDKLKLAPDFAKFIIDKVLLINSNIT